MTNKLQSNFLNFYLRSAWCNL